MRSRIPRTVLIVAWLIAAVTLSLSGLGHATRALITVVVGLPSAAVFASDAVRSVSPVGPGTRTKVRDTLKSALIAMYHANLFTHAEVLHVGFHVWALPLWYRRCPPQMYGRLPDRIKGRLEPKLHLVAAYSFVQKDPSEVTFTLDVGLIGRCVAANDSQRIMVVRLDRGPAKRLLKAPVADWEACKDVTVTQNLPQSDAVRLAKSYGQVAALVMRDGRDAIGCVTLDLPPDCNRRLLSPNQKAAKTDPVYRDLSTTTAAVARLLT
jgi:hypothetical protein